MKKITLFLIMLGFFLTANAQYDFAPIVGPTNVVSGTPATINLNDVANGAAVPVSSTGSYDSFSITVDWVAGGGNPWSSEADLTVTTTAGSVLIDPPTAGAAGSNADATMTFAGNFTSIYNPTTDGYIDLVLNQSFGGSDANWSNIVVTLFESPTCVVPSGMATSSLTTTDVNLTWNAGDAETIWNVEYNSGADFLPGNGEEEGSANVTGTPETSFSGLTPTTTYFVYYQADCGGADGMSEWVGPFNFFTDYCESMPTSNDGDGIGQVQLGNETFMSGGDLMYEDFTSPTVDLAAAITSNLQITFLTGFTYGTNVWIDLNNDLVYDNATELLYQGESTNANPTTLDASFTMPDIPLGVYNMRIGTADSGQATPNPCYSGTWGVTMDFTVNITAAPDCIPPSALTATTITEDSAELTWDGGATGVSWDLEWGPTGFTPGSGTLETGLTAQTFSLSTLSAGTGYDFYVVSSCAGGLTSTVSGPSTFFTATPGETCANAFPMTVEVDCDAAAPITFNFANGADLVASGESPSCDGFGNFGYWVSFTAPAIGSVIINFDGAADNIGFEVFDACGGTSITNCDDFNNNLDAGDNSGVIGGLTPGNTYYTVIWRDQQNGTADVCIEEGPDCPFPINLEAVNITDSSADLSWTENGTAMSWNIEWGPTGFTPGTGTAINAVTTNPYNLTSLTQNTEYDFYVQAICTGGPSDFEGPFIFSTTPQNNFVLDCALDGPLTQDYCYDNNGATTPFIFTFTSSDGTTPLNLTFNSGFVENGWDELVVLDSDGNPFAGFAIADENYGNAGNIGGLTFQSTGNTISFFINSDTTASCQSSTTGDLPTGINYTVSCATCINPQATYTVIDDCANGEQFLIDVDITSLGDATSLTISNNNNADTTPVTATGVYQIGPFPFLEDIIVSVSNDQDANCVINSQAIQLLACPPANDNCDGAITAVVNPSEACDTVIQGTILAATPSGLPAGSCTGTPDDDVWFQFTAIGDQQIIDIQNITGGTTNIDHALYEGACGSLTEIYCSPETASLTPQLVIGNTYFLRIFSAGQDAETSTFDLCISTFDPAFCYEAIPICADPDIDYPSIVGDQIAPPYLDYDCLGSQPDPQWNTIVFDEPGDYEFSLDQTDETGGAADVDFIVWGPFVDQESSCAQLLTENIVDCSFSATASETVTITGVPANSTYIILITNFSQDPGTYTFVQDSGPTDGTNCDVVCDVVLDVDGDIIEDVVEDLITPDDVLGYCGYDFVTLTASTFYAVDTYKWYKDGFEVTGNNTATLVATESGTYQVEVEGGICDDTLDYFSAIVEINFYDDADPVSPQNITLCDGPEADGSESFDLDNLSTSLGLDGFTITYYENVDDANQAMNPVSSPRDSTGETLIMRIQDTDAANIVDFVGCFDLSQVELVVNSRPTINQPSIFILCDNFDGNMTDNTTVFDLTSINTEVTTETGIAITYHNSEANAESGDADITSSAYTSSGETIYVRAENTATGCYNTTMFDLEVNMVPMATFDSTYDYEVCPNATVPKTIGLNADNFEVGEVTIKWYLDNVLISGENGLTLDNVLVAGEYSAVIEFNDSSIACNEPVFATVMELESCIFPKGISPGVSPGKNDTFDLSSFNVTKLEIFNRNGTLVYSKNNYIDEWVGQTNDGDELPVGTYFYTVIYEGGTKTKSDWIYINK